MDTTSLISAAAPALRYSPPTLRAWAPAVCFLLGDLAALFSIFLLAVWGTHNFQSADVYETCWQMYPVCLLFLASLFMQDLYPGFLLHPAEEMRRVSTSITIVSIGVICVLALGQRDTGVHLLVLLVIELLAIPLVLCTRSLVRYGVARNATWKSSAIIIGSGSNARRVIRSLQTSQPRLQILGVLTDEDPAEWGADLPPILGSLTSAPALWDGQVAHYAIVTMPDASHLETRRLIDIHSHAYRRIIFLPDLFGTCCLDIHARHIGGEIGIEVKQRNSRFHATVVKRIFDIAFSLLLISLIGPVWIIVAALIFYDSPGNILFAHTRAGRYGVSFRALKFRTMVTNADQVLTEYLATHTSHYQEWNETQKLKHDPRTTRFGNFLRRYSIDELPQLLNVLRGEMSIVGPRPIVDDEINRYGTVFELYKSVPPGLTGLWQISGRNNTSYPQRVAFDEYYVRNWSLWMDFYILSRTFKAVLTREGAY